MKNKLSGWVAGGLLAVAVFGVSLSNNNVASAAQSVPANMSMQQEKPINSDTTKEQEIQKPCCEAEGKTETSAAAGMMQSGKMNQDMMQSEEMQKQCGEMMKDKNMQKMMKNRVDDTKKEPVVSATSEQDHNAHRQI